MPRDGQKAITFYLPDELVAQIDEWADAEFRNRTNWIEVVVRNEIARRQGQEETAQTGPRT